MLNLEVHILKTSLFTKLATISIAMSFMILASHGTNLLGWIISLVIAIILFGYIAVDWHLKEEMLKCATKELLKLRDI